MRASKVAHLSIVHRCPSTLGVSGIAQSLRSAVTSWVSVFKRVSYLVCGSRIESPTKDIRKTLLSIETGNGSVTVRLKPAFSSRRDPVSWKGVEVPVGAWLFQGQEREREVRRVEGCAPFPEKQPQPMRVLKYQKVLPLGAAERFILLTISL